MLYETNGIPLTDNERTVCTMYPEVFIIKIRVLEIVYLKGGVSNLVFCTENFFGMIQKIVKYMF